MTPTAFSLIFLSVFLHVAWNFMSKSVRPSLAFYALMSGTSALILLPFFLASDLRLTLLPGLFFLILLGSVVAEVMYVTGLAHSYRNSDMSLSYPLARALPVLMIAGITLAFGIGERPSALALAGMGVTAVGCILMPLQSMRDFSLRHYFNRVSLYILLAALGTTGYTLADNRALTLIRAVFERASTMDVLAYLFLMESGLSLSLFVHVALLAEERAEFRRLFLRSPYPHLAGFSASGAYALVLLAMRHVSNVSFVQAFRQMSLPLGFLAGVIFLKESVSRPKLAGMILIVAGLVMSYLG